MSKDDLLVGKLVDLLLLHVKTKRDDCRLFFTQQKKFLIKKKN